MEMKKLQIIKVDQVIMFHNAAMGRQFLYMGAIWGLVPSLLLTGFQLSTDKKKVEYNLSTT